MYGRVAQEVILHDESIVEREDIITRFKGTGAQLALRPSEHDQRHTRSKVTGWTSV